MTLVPLQAAMQNILRLTTLLAAAAGLAAGPATALVGPSRDAPELAPHVVMVIDLRDKSYCTGSVIDRMTVLTAAHCVESPNTAAIYLPESAGTGAAFLKVADIAIHPGFRRDAARRRILSIDLALVRLAEPLPERFRPVTLSDTLPVETGQELTIAGFGIADETAPETGGILREGTVEVSASSPPFLVRLSDPRGFGLGGCTGDSGAPVFAPGGARVVAIAIWAKGENGSRCGTATEAALVAPQLHWFEAILQSWARETRAR